MFCIFAFIVFLILGIFSAKYRKLATKAWGCVWTRVTFRTCDVGLQQELRARLTGKLIIRHPKFAKFIARWIDVFAFVFVVLSVWSLLVVINSGINYYVYDTCSPKDPESCSLSAGACGVSSYKPGFVDSLFAGEVLLWAKEEVVAYGDKLSRIPDRMKTWKAEDYVSKTATYAVAYDSNKKTALEIIDPGCNYCAQMFEVTKKVDFAKKYNFTYILYPIPNPEKEGEYKFKNSLLVAKYIEGVKKYNKIVDGESADWKILEMIFTGNDINGEKYQKLFNEEYTSVEVDRKIEEWLISFGFDTASISKIKAWTYSDDVMQSIKEQKIIVDEKIRTVKIPTIIFDDRRYDRLVDEKTLGVRPL